MYPSGVAVGGQSAEMDWGMTVGGVARVPYVGSRVPRGRPDAGARRMGRRLLYRAKAQNQHKLS